MFHKEGQICVTVPNQQYKRERQQNTDPVLSALFCAVIVRLLSAE